MTLAPLPATLSGPTPNADPHAAQRAELRAQAEQLEAFLFTELLKVSGVKSPSATGGEVSQFETFLQRHQAEAVAASGQTGLAEAIYRSMARNLG